MVPSLPAGLFDPLTKVTKLTLADFYILDSLPSRTFATMPVLEKLHLLDFAVGEMFSDTFEGLSTVKELYVSLWPGDPHPSRWSRVVSCRTQKNGVLGIQWRVEERAYVGFQPETSRRHLPALD